MNTGFSIVSTIDVRLRQQQQPQGEGVKEKMNKITYH